MRIFIFMLTEATGPGSSMRTHTLNFWPPTRIVMHVLSVSAVYEEKISFKMDYTMGR